MKQATYTGKSGLYSCVRPVRGFSALFKAIKDPLYEEGITPLDMTDMHCTLMYSRNDAPHSLRIIKLLTDGPHTFKAWSDKLMFWEGHDKDGYIVLKLNSRDLAMRHEQYVELGCKHSFPEYEAHVTIASKLSKPKCLPALNRLLKNLKFEIIFAGEQVEDINKD